MMIRRDHIIADTDEPVILGTISPNLVMPMKNKCWKEKQELLQIKRAIFLGGGKSVIMNDEEKILKFSDSEQWAVMSEG